MFLLQKLLFSRGNLVGDDHPNPVLGKLELFVFCAFPSSIALIANEPGILFLIMLAYSFTFSCVNKEYQVYNFGPKITKSSGTRNNYNNHAKQIGPTLKSSRELFNNSREQITITKVIKFNSQVLYFW